MGQVTNSVRARIHEVSWSDGLRIVAVLLALTCLLSSPVNAQAAGSPSNEITLTTGEKNPVILKEIPLGRSKTLVEAMKVAYPEGPGSLVALRFLSNNTIVWPKARTVKQVVALGWSEKSKAWAFCTGLGVGDKENEVDVRPAAVNCNLQGSLAKGGAVVVHFEGDQAVVAAIPNFKAPVPGSDIGIGLTVLDLHNDEEGFRADGSTFAYYSLSNLKSERFRVIGQLATLDMVDDVDFETGVGVGFLFRPKNRLTSGPNSLGIAAGVGYNLMVDDSSDGWYTFVGFSWNFNRERPNQSN